MTGQQIQGLLTPYLGDLRLNEVQLEQVSAYLELLLKWNAKMNLTAVRRPEEIIARHFGESLFAAKSLLADGDVATLIDLGSGAGFPGLPMAIYSPGTRVTLIESQNKKATFLKEVVRSTGLQNIMVFNGRGEDYPGSAALVVLRAVEKFDAAARVAAGLVRPDGRLALMIGVGQEEALPAGFAWKVGRAVPGSDRRELLVGTRN